VRVDRTWGKAAQRAGVLKKLDALTDEDARRSIVASGSNLAGLVQHLTFVGLDVTSSAGSCDVPKPVRGSASPCTQSNSIERSD